MAKHELIEREYTELSEIPSLGKGYSAAAKDMIPPLAATRRVSQPTTAFEVHDVRIDPSHLAQYCHATGLRVSSQAPLTYPYVLSFPLVMQCMVAPDFPFKAIGTVHLRNTIEQFRPLTVTDSFRVRVFSQNLRSHPKGLLIDMVTEISVDGVPVWQQVSEFLSIGKYPTDGLAADQHEALTVPLAADPTAVVKVTGAQIKTYAAVSGDRNPIHVSTLGAKAFGFARTIAHGMWTSASLLALVEGSIPDAARYSVEFGKPVFLPSTIAGYAVATDTGWGLTYTSVKDPDKVHVRALINSL